MVDVLVLHPEAYCTGRRCSRYHVTGDDGKSCVFGTKRTSALGCEKNCCTLFVLVFQSGDSKFQIHLFLLEGLLESANDVYVLITQDTKIDHG